MSPTTESATPRVWDTPTRLFHWLLVFTVTFSWWSGEKHEMEWHYRSGIALLTLLAFRLIWGVVGGSTARFATFVRSPMATLAYLKGAPQRDAGHNPLGGYSVIAMLLLLCLQVGTGLVATDIDGLESGPLSYLVEFDQGRIAAKIHGASFNLLLVLIALHILTILFYLIVRRRNLVTPMLTGRDKDMHPEVSPLRPAGYVPLTVAVMTAVLAAWWVSTGAPI